MAGPLTRRLAMNLLDLLLPLSALVPTVLMALSALFAIRRRTSLTAQWQVFRTLAAVAWVASLCTLALAGLLHGLDTDRMAGLFSIAGLVELPGLALTPWAAWMSVLVQGLGLVIGSFSSRYLQGEPEQRRYIAGFATVLAAVHLLILADHWLVLIAAWMAVGAALQGLLCFYGHRPFALLAAHKKRLADRLADMLLLAAAALAWSEVGSGSLSALWLHLAQTGSSPLLQASAVCLVLAVVLRTALLPVHGWLIQVMEAPTPVSALLHAGVVNLGGYVLIRFAPLLDEAPLARWLLVGFGLGTAVLAGLVMLTRVSIKVRLAWSTVAQMGFMVLECGLGLYTLAALHLLGHSLYKAHAFLAASSVVRHGRLSRLAVEAPTASASLVAAPVVAFAAVLTTLQLAGAAAWPMWWSAVLSLAWAPLLWLPRRGSVPGATLAWRAASGLALVCTLALLTALAHGLPLGLSDQPDTRTGLIALLGMALLYVALVTLQWRPTALESWRRWSYAGFYLDEFYTRLALRLWPGAWARPDAARRLTLTSSQPLEATR